MISKLKVSFTILLIGLTCTLAQSQERIRVLFIGNSLTYANDMPALVAAIAESTKQKHFEYKTIAYPDFSLEDHWNQRDARKEITKGRWNFVVMQQGPSSLPESRVLLREYVKKFAEEIKRAGAKPVVYMVWPAVSRAGDFDRVVESYQLAASDVDAVLLPVGAAWREAFKADAKLPLYSSDAFHPSQLGSYLAAWVIFRRLYNNPNVSMPDRVMISSANIKLKPVEVTLLNEATEKVLR